MHLWNDYEGTTLAGQWTLGRLLRTEGRSALFATTKQDGAPAVIRLTEALNDQAVLAARYRAIQAAGDQYLVAVEGFGDTELDGAPVSYAVLEATQESLADILSNRRLDAEEVHEVAKSVAGGLLALHAQGLVHGLVEPESVLAATDRIKLRSDCARPAPHLDDADLEGAVTAKTDAFGLAGVIYQSLTQGRLHGPSDALALPEPFSTIVRNTARGQWGVPEVAAELARGSRPAPAAPPAAPVPTAPVHTTLAAGSAGRVNTAPPAAEPVVAEERPLSSRATVTPVATESAWREPAPASAGRRGLALLAAGVLLLAALLFAVFHRSGKPAVQHAVAPVPLAAPIAGGTAPTPVMPPPAVHRAPAVQAAAAPATPQLAPGQKVWRVIAYTYNRRSEAEGKAASVNARYPGFDAEVWSRTGEAPYLVTLGGPMSQAQALALRSRARHAGLAQDLYAQNYSR